MSFWINNIQRQKTKNTDCAELKPHKPNSTTGAVFHTNTELGASVEADVKTKERGEPGGLKEGQGCWWAPLHPITSPDLWRVSGCHVLWLRGSQTSRSPPWGGSWAASGG